MKIIPFSKSGSGIHHHHRHHHHRTMKSHLVKSQIPYIRSPSLSESQNISSMISCISSNVYNLLYLGRVTAILVEGITYQPFCYQINAEINTNDTINITNIDTLGWRSESALPIQNDHQCYRKGKLASCVKKQEIIIIQIEILAPLTV